MRNDSESLTEGRSETNIDHALDFFPEPSIEDIKEGTKLNSITPAAPLVSREDIRARVKRSYEHINKFGFVSGSTTSDIPFDENWLGLFEMRRIILSEIREIILSEFRQLPETHWIQNLRHSSYHLCQPIPILIEKAEGTVTATYDDVELCGTGDSVKAAISDLCTKIVARYEELGESPAKSQEYTFLKQIIEEIESPAWQELKELYKEKLEEIPYVKEGYIKIEGNDADVVIVLSEESVEIIEQLAEIDLEINLQFRPLYFFVEYESSEDYLELDDFECFY